ncbi:hypothetical protein CcI49_23335 [Frankia sp. CcI49]|uniref:hypothetical protein n=1 Tax=Frankia sp. CcI49 TaxID=1745382 RepID=UPI000977D71B|nr:hypothetical protein [Frankia sp. CcI49]ONH58391.1 hypothetical protein CcI49_23335 [Frankia sp. CcI49]
MTTESAALPRRFLLVRYQDISGVSGTGEVAQGACWDDGVAALHWHGEHRSTGIYTSMEQVEAIHGHGGATRVVWLDAPCPDGVAPVAPPVTPEGECSCDRDQLGWHVISGMDFLDLLRRCSGGENADAVYAEVYANAEREYPDGGTDGD